jgi:prepilin-type N-terminal cleavage/methylation domain-containing protein
MKKTFKGKQGFTLIEFLIVLTILGILISLAVVSIRESSVRSKNSRIATDLSEVRKIAENIYLEAGNGYLNLCQSGHLNQSDPDLDIIESDIQKLGGSTTCYSAYDSYCVSVSLAGGKGFICIDDEGHFGGPYDVNPCLNEGSSCP